MLSGQPAFFKTYVDLVLQHSSPKQRPLESLTALNRVLNTPMAMNDRTTNRHVLAKIERISANRLDEKALNLLGTFELLATKIQ